MSTPTSRGPGGPVLRIYLAGATAGALFSVCTYFVGVRPAVARHEDHATRQLDLRAARQKAASLLATRNATQAQLNTTNEALKNLTLRLEPASTVNQRLSILTEVATRECQLVIDEMHPGTVVESAECQAIPILMAGSGTYPNCAKFLHKVRQKFPDTGNRRPPACVGPHEHS